MNALQLTGKARAQARMTAEGVYHQRSFSLGALRITTAAQRVLRFNNPWSILGQHLCGSTGDLDSLEDRRYGVEALERGYTFFSAWRLNRHVIVIVTSADRRTTTIGTTEDFGDIFELGDVA